MTPTEHNVWLDDYTRESARLPLTVEYRVAPVRYWQNVEILETVGCGPYWSFPCVYEYYRGCSRAYIGSTVNGWETRAREHDRRSPYNIEGVDRVVVTYVKDRLSARKLELTRQLLAQEYESFYLDTTGVRWLMREIARGEK